MINPLVEYYWPHFTGMERSRELFFCLHFWFFHSAWHVSVTVFILMFQNYVLIFLSFKQDVISTRTEFLPLCVCACMHVCTYVHGHANVGTHTSVYKRINEGVNEQTNSLCTLKYNVKISASKKSITYMTLQANIWQNRVMECLTSWAQLAHLEYIYSFRSFISLPPWHLLMCPGFEFQSGPYLSLDKGKNQELSKECTAKLLYTKCYAPYLD